MDINMFLLTFGLNPEQFDDHLEAPFIDPTNGITYFYVRQRSDERECPFCKRSDDVVVKAHYDTWVNDCLNPARKTIIAISKPKFFCKRCGRYFTVPLEGIEKFGEMTNSQKRAMNGEFLTNQTFSEIARRYGISKSYAMNIFDGCYKNVPSRPLPKVLCIDEIHFSGSPDGKFPAVLYDWERREVVDLIRSRQMPYLKEYFDGLKPGTLAAVKYFVTDMYDAYATIARKYLPNAMIIVDFFHVVQLLTNAVSKLRTRAMNGAGKGTFEYSFMKSKWRLFLCRSSKIPASKEYSAKGCDPVPYPDAVFRCVKSNGDLWDGYDILQELLKYHEYDTWTQAAAFVERIAKRLISCPSELLKTVGRSYAKWGPEIANGLAKNQTGMHFSNSVAEGLNADIQGLKRLGHGYANFERFRKRILLFMTYSKKP